jgi:hypothetical protein
MLTTWSRTPLGLAILGQKKYIVRTPENKEKARKHDLIYPLKALRT